MCDSTEARWKPTPYRLRGYGELSEGVAFWGINNDTKSTVKRERWMKIGDGFNYWFGEGERDWNDCARPFGLSAAPYWLLWRFMHGAGQFR